MFFVYSIRTYVRERMFVYVCVEVIVVRQPLQIIKSCEKAAFEAARGSCDVFSRAAKGAAFYFRFKKAAFSSFFAGLRTKFDKKIQIFSEKSYKNLKKLVENLTFKVKFWRRMSQQKQNKI